VRVGIRWHRWTGSWRLRAGMRMQENAGAGKTRAIGMLPGVQGKSLASE
jgi:hypothetical protein